MNAFDCSLLFSLGHEIQSVFLKNELCLATAPVVHYEFFGGLFDYVESAITKTEEMQAVLGYPILSSLCDNRKLSCVVAIETSNRCTWQIAGHFKEVNSAGFLGSTGLTCDSLFRCSNISWIPDVSRDEKCLVWACVCAFACLCVSLHPWHYLWLTIEQNSVVCVWAHFRIEWNVVVCVCTFVFEYILD